MRVGLRFVTVDGDEPFRLESVGFGMNVRIVREVPLPGEYQTCPFQRRFNPIGVYLPNIREHHRSFRNEVAFAYVVFRALMRETHWGYWVPTKSFLHNGIDVWKIVTVRQCR